MNARALHLDAPLLDPILLPPGTTLRQAIAAHRARLGGAVVNDEDPSVAALFDAHDAVHAVFGAATDLRSEGMTDAWTLFGTTMPLRRYLTYIQHPAVTGILRSVPLPRLLWTAMASVPVLLRVIARSRDMARPWDFDAWADHLDRPVEELRVEYGIAPIR